MRRVCGFVVSAWRATFSAARFAVLFAAMRCASGVVVHVDVVVIALAIGCCFMSLLLRPRL